MNALTIQTILKETTSTCPVCNAHVPATVVKKLLDGREQVVMQRECPCHGHHEYVISSDARFYWLAHGNPLNRRGKKSGDTEIGVASGCGCGKTCSASERGTAGYLGTNALDQAKQGSIERLSTCLALIEIVDSCNLACPTCFADAPQTRGADMRYHSFENITGRIQSVLDRKGHIEVLQFSGGEPTIHPEFFRLVEWVRQNPRIDYLLINTNGIRFAADRAFVEKIGHVYHTFDNIQLYMQFDGPEEAGQRELRGLDLRTIRDKAVRNCGQVGLPITLAMTVTRLNLPQLWKTVSYGLAFEHVRGVSFQPEFLSGRNEKKNVSIAYLPQPITAADIIVGLHEQSGGTIPFGDFTPLPCGDPNCATIGWIFRIGTTYLSPSQHGIDIPALQAKMPDRVSYDIETLKKCGCEDTALGDLMKSLEVKESNAFRLFIKPFMDERTWDEDRIDRCCTHVIRPDGALDSFCRYYARKPVEKTCC